METNEASVLVLPNIFTARLWHLVNSPEIPAIEWDSQGEIVIIDRVLLKEMAMVPTVSDCQVFKPIKFSSFFRQLYVYGFRQTQYSSTSQPNLLRFFHPNFKKNNPELLLLMNRTRSKCQKPQQAVQTNILPEEKREIEDVDIKYETLHHQSVQPIPIMSSNLESTLPPQFHRNNQGTGPSVIYNRPQAPHGNYHTNVAPYTPSGFYSCPYTGFSHMFNHPGYFVPGYYSYQMAPNAAGSFGFYWMGYQANIVQVPPIYSINPHSAFSPKMPPPSSRITEITESPSNHPNPASQLPHVSTDRETSSTAQCSVFAQHGAVSQDIQSHSKVT